MNRSNEAKVYAHILANYNEHTRLIKHQGCNGTWCYKGVNKDNPLFVTYECHVCKKVKNTSHSFNAQLELSRADMNDPELIILAKEIIGKIKFDDSSVNNHYEVHKLLLTEFWPEHWYVDYINKLDPNNRPIIK